MLSIGFILIMEQAVGHCGGSESRTEMFRTSHHDSKRCLSITPEFFE